MPQLLFFGDNVKCTGSAQAAGDPGGSKPWAPPSQLVQSATPPCPHPAVEGRDGCRLVFVCNDKTSSTTCLSSTDGVACRLFCSGSPHFSRPGSVCWVQESWTETKTCLGSSKVRVRRQPERSKCPLRTSPRCYAIMDQTGPAIRPGSTAILAVQLRPYGWLSLVLSESIQWAPYLQRNIVEPLTGSHHRPGHGPWSIPPRTAPGRQSRELAHNALDLEPGQSSIWAPRPCTLPVRGAEPQTVLHDIQRWPSLETLPICLLLHLIHSSRICSCCNTVVFGDPQWWCEVNISLIYVPS